MSGTEEASVGRGTPQWRQSESMADLDDLTVLDDCKVYGLTHREIGNRLRCGEHGGEHLVKGVRECAEYLDRTRNLNNNGEEYLPSSPR